MVFTLFFFLNLTHSFTDETTIMKKFWVILFVSCLVWVHAQEENEPVEYQTAAGLYIDYGKDAKFVGPHIKQFLGDWHAVGAQLLFGNKTMVIGVDYTNNYDLRPLPTFGVYWGVGAQIALYKGDEQTSFALRPAVGIEYKARKYPVVVAAELKPAWSFGKNGEFDFGRFGLGLRYVINRNIW